MNSGLECPSWKQNSIWPGGKLHGSLIQLPGSDPSNPWSKWSKDDINVHQHMSQHPDLKRSMLRSFHTYPSISQNIYIIYLWICQIFLNIYNQYISPVTAYDQPTDNFYWYWRLSIRTIPSLDWFCSSDFVLTGNQGVYHQIWWGFL